MENHHEVMKAEEKNRLRRQIDLGVRASVAAALEEHARAGRKVAIWRDGRIVQLVPPLASAGEALVIREDPPAE